MRRLLIQKKLTQERHKGRKKILPSILLVLVLVLIVFQVAVSNQLATKGLEMSEIESKIQKIKSENADLRQQVASASALTTISVRAKLLGFEYPIKPLYLTKENVVAMEKE